MKNIRFLFFLSTSLTLMFPNFFSVWAEPPTRAKIVFTATRDGNGEIYIMNADGSGEVRLTNHPGDDFDPVWSPTGEHIAFVSEREHQGLYDIYLMDPDGGNIRQAFNDLEYRTAPTWSPDAENIAYHTYSPVPDWAVYFSRLGGGKPERLSEAAQMTRGGFPAWSPDGTEIAFTDVVEGRPVVADPRIVVAPLEMHIWIINLQTREKERLLPRLRSGDTYYPVWSPDGTKLAFYWRQRDQQKAGIYIVNRNGRMLDEIVKDASGPVAWSPDGRDLLYQKTVDGQKQLFKVNLHSRVKTPLAPLGPTIRHGLNRGWDWFDPKILPVSPTPELLTTIWAKVKTTN